MVESVEGARAALPLLAFAVSRLWEKRDREKKVLTRAAYEEIGGVAGALAQHAERRWTASAPSARAWCGRSSATSSPPRGRARSIDREELLSVFPEREAAEEVLRSAHRRAAPDLLRESEADREDGTRTEPTTGSRSSTSRS